jgi:hypothetical protein
MTAVRLQTANKTDKTPTILQIIESMNALLRRQGAVLDENVNVA